MNLCLKGHYFSRDVQHVTLSQNGNIYVYFSSDDKNLFEYIEVDPSELEGDVCSGKINSLKKLLTV